MCQRAFPSSTGSFAALHPMAGLWRFAYWGLGLGLAVLNIRPSF